MSGHKKEHAMSFHYKKTIGVIPTNIEWLPGPYPISRRRAVLDGIKNLEPGTFLEFGCGVGTLTYDFFLKGYQCDAYDMERKAIECALYIYPPPMQQHTGSLVFHDNLEKIQMKSYDYIAAFEVLEHIENDKEALMNWKNYLKDNGKIIMTVPAHMKLFSNNDIYGGHFRRYEKPELISLLNNCGFQIVNFLCYGFPFINLMIKVLDKMLWEKRKNIAGDTMDERTRRASYVRTLENRFTFLTKATWGISILFSYMQKLFYETDLGVGYVVVAKKLR
jgi:2-polyprenyl-3-methyl-5-hydroxy-6-metoxy-1,4-benzoquinol methylase